MNLQPVPTPNPTVDAAGMKPSSLSPLKTLLSWTAATISGMLLGFVLAYLLIFTFKLVNPSFNEDRLMGYLLFPCLGLMSAALQWLILRRWLASAWLWLPLSLLGWLIWTGLVALVLPIVFDQGMAFSWLYFVLLGAALGLSQWPLLHHRLPAAWLWPLASLLGWLLAGLVIGRTIDTSMDILAIGLLPGLVGGLALALLLRWSALPAAQAA